MPGLGVQKYKSIVVLTGAGISAASGLPTYRGPAGIWNDPDTAKLSTADNFQSEPAVYWKFWGDVRSAAARARPNMAHTALAQCQTQLKPEQKLTLITQNIDELHQRAGSSNVVELHGSIFKTRCSNDACKTSTFRDESAFANVVPHCPTCASPLRPAIVFFGEALPAEADWGAKRALRDCDLFIAIGTSGTVSPASRFVEWAKLADAETVFINLEKMNPRNPAFNKEFIGPAEELLPDLLK